jgi:hypothetical protein
MRTGPRRLPPTAFVLETTTRNAQSKYNDDDDDDDNDDNTKVEEL